MWFYFLFTCCLSKWSLSAPRWCSVLLLFTRVWMFILQPAQRRFHREEGPSLRRFPNRPGELKARGFPLLSAESVRDISELRLPFTADAPRLKEAGKANARASLALRGRGSTHKRWGEGRRESPSSSSSSCPLASTSTYRQVVFRSASFFIHLCFFVCSALSPVFMGAIQINQNAPGLLLSLRDYFSNPEVSSG